MPEHGWTDTVKSGVQYVRDAAAAEIDDCEAAAIDGIDHSNPRGRMMYCKINT